MTTVSAFEADTPVGGQGGGVLGPTQKNCASTRWLTSEAFEPEKYHDTYSDKVREAVEQKVAGQEITIAPEAPRAQIIDLFDALKKTLAEGPKPPPSVLKGPKKTEPKSDDDEEEASPKKKRAKG